MNTNTTRSVRHFRGFQYLSLNSAIEQVFAGASTVKKQLRRFNSSAAYWHELNAAAWSVELCKDRILSAFNMPKKEYLGRLHRTGLWAQFRPLSIREIIELYRDPAQAEFFDKDTVQAISDYLSATRSLSDLRKRCPA